MCGVLGILTHNESVVPRLLRGLEVLEPRGYDSTGIAVLNGSIHLMKRAGGVANLRQSLDESVHGSVGIAHTRWATHGKPSDVNAHPHLSADGTVAVAHNGIIENYRELRAELENGGVVFQSDTDTEVIPNLIARELKRTPLSLAKAVQRIVPLLKGEYAILVLSKLHPGELVAACLERPLILGRGGVCASVASSEVALVGHADEVAELHDGEVAIIAPDGSSAVTGHKKKRWIEVQKTFRPISQTAEDISKDGFGTFMEKEIHEQPKTVVNALRGRINDDQVHLAELGVEAEHAIREAPFITASACGTSYYALLAAKLLFERIAGLPLIVEHASEYQDRNPCVTKGSLFIAVSQSGETADTVGALKYAHEHGAYTLAVTNAKGSQLARLAHADISVQAGPERAVASTKAYTGQVVTLALLAIRAGVLRGTLSDLRRGELVRALQSLSSHVEEVLARADDVEKIAEAYKHAPRLIVIGKGFAVPLAYEGALKIQEIAYMDSFGFPSGELKHGPLALVTEHVPVVAIALNGTASGRVLSNSAEVRARGGDIIAVVSQGSAEEKEFRGSAQHVLALPSTLEEMTPVLGAMIVQLLALYLGIARGNDVDKPRNLAKSVTVR